MKLLYGLVNEHFEEKTETNYEHYKDEIIEGWMLDLALVDGKCIIFTDKISIKKHKKFLIQKNMQRAFKLGLSVQN